jgi:hypothetical protein
MKTQAVARTQRASVPEGHRHRQAPNLDVGRPQVAAVAEVAMSYSEKQQLFFNGRYVLRIQPLVTSGWTLADWISYVDRFGRWINRSLAEDSA